MQLDTRIPLSFATPDFVGTMARGAQAGQFVNEARHQNALRSAVQQHGAGLVAGDDGARNALAGFDPGMVMQADAHRQTMSHNDQRMELAYQQAKMQAQKMAAQISEADRQRIVQEYEQGINIMGTAQSPEQWDQFAQRLGLQDAVGDFENRGFWLAQGMGVKDALEVMGGGQQGFRMATPEEAAQYGATAGQFGPDGRFHPIRPDSGMEIIQGPDGGFTFRQGAGVGANVGPAPDVSTAAPDSGAGDQFRSAPDAFGAGSVGRGIINRVADAVAGRVPFPETMEAQQDFRVFGEGLINAFASAYGRQPPSWLLRNIEELTPKPGRLLEGPQQAQSKLRSISRDLRQRREGFAQQLDGARRVQNREDLVAQIAGIDATLIQLNAAMEGFQAPAGDLSPDVEDILRLYE